jgi:hypothetical protein
MITWLLPSTAAMPALCTISEDCVRGMKEEEASYLGYRWVQEGKEKRRQEI